MPSPRVPGDALATLLSALQDRDPTVRSEVCRALIVLSDSSTVLPLVLRHSDDDDDVRNAAADALRDLTRSQHQVPTPGLVGELSGALHHENPHVRAAACAVLGEWRAEAARDELLLCAMSGKSTPAASWSEVTESDSALQLAHRGGLFGDEEELPLEALDLFDDWDEEGPIQLADRLLFGEAEELTLEAPDLTNYGDPERDISGPLAALDRIAPSWRDDDALWSRIEDWVTTHGQDILDSGLMHESGAPEHAVLPGIRKQTVRRTRRGFSHNGCTEYETTVRVRYRLPTARSAGQALAMEGATERPVKPAGVLALLSTLDGQTRERARSWLAATAPPPLLAGALALLALSRSESAATTLCRLTRDAPLAVRLLALRFLPFTEHRSCHEALLDAAHDASPALRRIALLGLGLSKQPEKPPPPHLRRRRISIRRQGREVVSLLSEPGPGTRTRLEQALASDPDHQARACAFYAMLSNGWLTLKELPLSLDNQAAAVRALAAGCIPALVDGGLVSLPISDANEHVANSWELDSARRELRENCLPKLLAGLEELGEAETRARLEALGALDPDLEIPESPSEQFPRKLATIYRQLTPRAQRISSSALAAGGTSVPVETWLDLLGNPEASVRTRARDILQAMPNDWRQHPQLCTLKHTLRTQLQSAKPSLRMAAALGLAVLGDSGGLVQLVELLAVEPGADEAQAALAGLKDAAFDALAEALDDPRPTLRKRAVELLGELGASHLIQRMLEDDALEVCTSALQLVARGQVEVSLDALVLQSHAAEASLRIEVAKALERYPIADSVMPLLQLATDEDAAVRDAAYSALNGAGSTWLHAASQQDGIRWLSGRFLHRLADVRAACIRLLAEIESKTRGAKFG